MFEANMAIFKSINHLGIDFPFLNPVFIMFAEYSVAILALFLIYHWFFKKNRKPVLLGSVIFITAEIFARTLIGKLHFNYQPFYYYKETNLLISKELNNSFPSDHTILVFSFMIAFIFYSKKVSHKIIYLFIAIMVGVSRIGVGVHFPFDVLMSIVLTLLLLVLAVKINSKTNFLDLFLTIYDRYNNNIKRLIKK